jgi:hypothetical protein
VILALIGCLSPPEPEPVPAPLAAPAPAPIVALEAGENTTCTLRDDGALSCTGALTVEAAGVFGALEVSDARVCARADGQERCWFPGGQVRDRPTPFVEVAGDCGRDPDGGLWCRDPRLPDDPEGIVPIAAPAPATKLVAGPSVCALLETGELGCFEAAAGGRWQRVVEGVDELDGTWLQRCWRRGTEVTCRGERALPVPALEAPRMLTVGRFHACALDGAQAVCWGDSEPPPALSDVRALSAGDDVTCALTGDDRVHCWD